MPGIITVDLHHQVLPHWENCRAPLPMPPMVITLDFHTDTLDCRRRLPDMPETCAAAVNILHHDEHFDWALRRNIISRAVIIAVSPCAILPEHPALEVRRHPELPEMHDILNSPEKFRPLAEMFLDDRFLAPLLPGGVPAEPYILDIDCDYILCRKALRPEQSSLIRSLAENALLITISRENDWVKLLRLPQEDISGSVIAGELLPLLKPSASR